MVYRLGVGFGQSHHLEGISTYRTKPEMLEEIRCGKAGHEETGDMEINDGDVT